MLGEEKLHLNQDQYYYTSRPDVQKIYSTQEIAEYLDISLCKVRNIVAYYKIPRTISPTKNSRAAFYTYDAVREIKAHLEAEKNKKKQMEISKKVIEKEQSLEELAALHPLVTDKRFLKLSYFPEVLPACFQECEE